MCGCFGGGILHTRLESAGLVTVEVLDHTHTVPWVFLGGGGGGGGSTMVRWKTGGGQEGERGG